MASFRLFLFYGCWLASFRVGCGLRQRFDQFLQTRFALITFGAFAIGLDPFRMLSPQVFVNLLFELCVAMDLVRHPGQLTFKCVWERS